MSTERSPSRPVFAASRRVLMVAAAVCALAPLSGRGDTAGAAGEAGAEFLTSRPRPAAPAATPATVGERIRTGPGQRRRLALPGGAVLYVDQQSEVQLEAPDRLLQRAGAIFVEVGPGRTSAVEVVTPARVVKPSAASFGVSLEARGTRVVATRGQAEVARGGRSLVLPAGMQLAPDRDEPTRAA